MGRRRSKTPTRPQTGQFPRELLAKFSAARQTVLAEQQRALDRKKRDLDVLCQDCFDQRRAKYGWKPGQAVFPDDPNWDKRHSLNEESRIDELAAFKVIGAVHESPDVAALRTVLSGELAAQVVVQRLQTGELFDPPEPRPVVELRGIGQRPIVNGVEVEPLSEPRYLVIKALLDAGRDGLCKPDLEKIKGDAIKYLRELSRMPIWRDAIIMPGRPWSRYAIVHR